MIDYEILIPAYNAEATIEILLKQIKQLKESPVKVYVVDDGSHDSTLRLSKAAGAYLIRHEVNYGKGAALKKGFQEFLTRSAATYLLCLDADLQHPVASIPDFLNKAAHEHSKVIIGNRKKHPVVMPFFRVISNLMTSSILSVITGQRIKDSQCGFRLIHRDILENLHMQENGFQLESEFIIEASRQGVPIDFVDIPTIYNHRSSSINHILDTYRFLCLIGREFFRKKYVR
jgi:glycosyltransferase involved in cell wall biosynthesis